MVKVLVDVISIGLDLAISSIAYMVITNFKNTEQGQWVLERNLEITYTIEDDSANMGLRMNLYVSMANDEEAAEYTLKFK
jgi:hypothetical protein